MSATFPEINLFNFFSWMNQFTMLVNVYLLTYSVEALYWVMSKDTQ